MSTLNQVNIIGTLSKDSEVRTTNDGKSVLTFSIPTSERYKQGSEWKEITEWHNIAIYNEKIIEYYKDALKKGTKVYIQGQIKTYEKNGEKRISIVLKNYNGTLVIIEKAKIEQKEERPISAPSRDIVPPSMRKTHTQEITIDDDFDEIPF